MLLRSSEGWLMGSNPAAHDLTGNKGSRLCQQFAFGQVGLIDIDLRYDPLGNVWMALFQPGPKALRCTAGAMAGSEQEQRLVTSQDLDDVLEVLVMVRRAGLTFGGVLVMDVTLVSIRVERDYSFWNRARKLRPVELGRLMIDYEQHVRR